MKIFNRIRNIINHVGDTKFKLQKILVNTQKSLVIEKDFQYYLRKEFLQQCVNKTTQLGISNDKISDAEVIVSLTTYGKRIYNVYLTIESIMQGSIRPNRIILWLSETEFNKSQIPHALFMQQKKGLQIEFCEDILSYKKLIPTLKLYPDACIVTIDDDVIYDYNFLSNLLITHNSNKKAICANRIHRFKVDNNNKLLSYYEWQDLIYDYDKSKFNFFTGVGGILYPPHSLNNEVFNKSVFMEICRYGDDIWFFVMAKLNNTEIIKSFSRNSEGDFMEMIEDLEEPLSIKNTSKISCRNDEQISKVFEKYNMYTRLSINQ